jgi:excisionase family DNA binding protein
MNKNNALPKLLTISQAAEILHVHPETLRRWDRQGRLKSVRIGTRQNWGDRKYRIEDIERLSQEKGVQSTLTSKEPTLTKLPEPIKLSGRQKNIWQYLVDTNPRAADAYAGAIRVREDTLNPDRMAQSAHSLRELNLLLVPKPKQTIGNKEEGGHVNRIKSYMKSQDLLGGLPEEIAQKVAKQWVDTYDWFCAVAHHGRVPDQNKFEQELQTLENIIESQIGPFYNSVEKLDQLIAQKRVSASDTTSLKTIIKKQAHYEYFFKTVTNPSWLPILAKEGYFKKPVEPIKDDEGGIRFPAWVEAEYLIKIADKKPSEVCDLILKSAKTENPWVHCDFIDAAIKMPSKIAIKLLPKIKSEGWFNQYFMSRPADKGGELMVNFIKDGEIDKACELASLLLDVKKVEKDDSVFTGKKNSKTFEVKSCIDDWQYGQLLEKDYPILVEVAPIRAVGLLVTILEKAIRHVTGKADYQDSFIINYKRPSIEDNEQNWAKEDVENMLITAIRDSIDTIAKKNPGQLKEVVASLGHTEGVYPVLLRIQLDAYRKYPTVFENEIAVVLSNREYFFDDRLIHEYRQLLTSHFPSLPTYTKESIFKWITKGPGGEFKDKKLEYWQTQKLDLIKDSLPDNWKTIYEELAKKYKPEPSEFGAVVSSWVGPTSPAKEEELASKNPDDVIKFLTDWKPIKDPTAPSPDGLGRVFENLVTKSAVSYSKKFKQMFDVKVRVVYLYSFITGLRNAHKQGLIIEWDDIFPTLDKITFSDNPYDYPKDEGFYETGWNGVRKAIADLLEDILKKGPNELPYKYRDQVWTVLGRLVEDRDPDIEHEKKYGGKNMNPTTLSINTVRGDALHSLIYYSLWVSRNTYPDEKATILPDEVKVVLEKHLVPTNDPTQTTRSVYGQYYPWLYFLDKKWAADHLDEIFRPFNNELPQVAWRAYLGYATLWIPALNFLKPLYQEAVNGLNSGAKRDEVDNRLAEHLMISFWRGDIDLDDPVIVSFYKNAPETMRAHAVWFLWRSIEEAKLQKSSPEWKRLRLLWQERLKVTSGRQSDEISRFADWLSCIPEDINESYELVKPTIPHLTRGSDVGYLIGYLKSNLGVNIELVSELLYETVKENTEDIKYRIHDQDISQILTAAIQSGSTKACDFANKVINMFGERGNHAFKGILSQSN